MLKLKNMKKQFGDLTVLDGIDLELKKGEVAAIIGPSGTGKSTLLRCINLLETPTEKQFGDLTVLDGIDLELKKGEVAAIIGPSGTGKSTLLRCINLLETPTEGTIEIDGFSVDSKNLSPKDCI